MATTQQKGPLWTALEDAFVKVLDAGYDLKLTEDPEYGLWRVLLTKPMVVLDGPVPGQVQFRILASDPDKAEAVRKALRAHNIPVPDEAAA